MWGAVGVFVFGLLIAVYWMLAMFTDTGPGEFARDISAEVGHKNNLSLTVPAAGLMAVSAAPLGIPAVAESGLGMVLGLIGGFCVLLILVSLLPITLPAWMYPEWHVEWRRRRRRERLARENSWRDASRLGPGELGGSASDRTNDPSNSKTMHPSPDSSGDDV